MDAAVGGDASVLDNIEGRSVRIQNDLSSTEEYDDNRGAGVCTRKRNSEVFAEEADNMSDDDFGPSIPPTKVGDASNLSPSSPAESHLKQSDDEQDIEVSQYAVYMKRVPVEKPQAEPKKLQLEKFPEKIYCYGEDDMYDGVGEDGQDAFANTAHEQKLSAMEFSIPKGRVDECVLNENPWRIPLTHEVLIRGHTKVVSSVALDYRGLHMASGSWDGRVKLWDFYSMDKSLQAFNCVEPYSHTVVNSLSWDIGGERLLLALNNPQAMVYTREGVRLLEFAKGYQFALDKSNTDGHTSDISHAIWHTVYPERVISVGEDSTCRIWDCNRPEKQLQVIKVRNIRGGSTLRVTRVAIDVHGQCMVVGTNEGSLQLFEERNGSSRVVARCDKAHQAGSDIAGIEFSPNKDMFVSRGTADETMKMWDLRKLSVPVATFENLSNLHAQTALAFNPTGNIVCTGTSLTREKRTAYLAFADMTTTKIQTIPIASEDVVGLTWHHKLNQIVVGCADGTIKVFFDPRQSRDGVLKALTKNIRQPDGEVKVGVSVMAPREHGALSERAKRRKLLKDPAFGRTPAAPHHGPGSHGLLGSSLKADYMKKILNMSNKNVFEDPRDALLRQAGKDTPKNNHLDYEGLKKLETQELERLEQIERMRRRVEK